MTTGAFDFRIAEALERIADALERANENIEADRAQLDKVREEVAAARRYSEANLLAASARRAD